MKVWVLTRTSYEVDSVSYNGTFDVLGAFSNKDDAIDAAERCAMEEGAELSFAWKHNEYKAELRDNLDEDVYWGCVSYILDLTTLC